MIVWLDWGPEAFARAAAENKPVLLSITAAWCRSCHEMDRTGYADPAVAALVNSRFVPVRVDADRRPDVSDRYNLGGWPTTAFLTPEGDVLGGGTYFTADRLADLLRQVADAFASRRGEIGARAAVARQARGEPGPAGARPDAVGEACLDRVCRLVVDAFDGEYGGFGVEPKFPIVEPVALALERHVRTGDERLRTVVGVTLDAIGWGGLYDPIDGGFFRYTATRDWQLPHTEKMLETNAALLRIYLDAWAALGVERYRERALDVLRYVDATLADPEGGFFGSQQSDDRYYAASEAERRQLTPPPVDRCLYADWNAQMVSALLRAAEVLDRPALAEAAIRSLERVVLANYRPGHGVTHYFDGQPRVGGLLADQVHVAAALVDAHAASGNVVYEMMAEELMWYGLRVLWDEESGGFFDRVADGAGVEPGLMQQRLKPFAANCHAARVLLRLGPIAGEPDFRARALETLAAIAPALHAQGVSGALYGLAILDSLPPGG